MCVGRGVVFEAGVIMPGSCVLEGRFFCLYVLCLRVGGILCVRSVCVFEGESLCFMCLDNRLLLTKQPRKSMN